ncbi:MAG TPA: anti-phage dCTP deaminase [Terriglobia bacterium]|nr:anti-phage dCTP deaminase [Terriglobia bacterium]
MKPPPLSSLEYAESELVVGLVYAAGTNARLLEDALVNHIEKFGYQANIIRLSEQLGPLIKSLNLKVKLKNSPEYERVSTRMDAGNKARARVGRADLLALAAVTEICKQRRVAGTSEVMPKTAHILFSLKRPEEVFALRRVYGRGFFLIGVFASEKDRLKYLQFDKGIPEDKARALIERDQEEKEQQEPFGQRTRDTFHLADVFVRMKGDEYKIQSWRFLDLIFGNPYETPTQDENAMYLASAASLRSAQLGRQVGAAIADNQGDVIGVGCNDVPCAGGGLYWAGESDQRDHKKGEDSNERCRNEIISDIMKRLRPKVHPQKRIAEGKRLLVDSPLMDITEFGRAVHAEMEAVLACVRSGVSPREGSLYTTTFPCHNCTRHIVAAGIRRVVYIEPYPKSRAFELHDDSIRDAQDRDVENGDKRVAFEPFVGVGPRRYFDLFSMRMGTGYEVRRKTENGKTVSWEKSAARLRVPMLPNSYLQREKLAVSEYSRATEKSGGHSEARSEP